MGLAQRSLKLARGWNEHTVQFTVWRGGGLTMNTLPIEPTLVMMTPHGLAHTCEQIVCWSAASGHRSHHLTFNWRQTDSGG